MFFEISCAVCATRGSVVCGPCKAGFRRLAGASGSKIEVASSAEPVRAVFELEPGIRSLIAELKYRRERRLSRWVAQQLAPLVPRGADAITWVPATPARARQRGFDQASEIARDLAALTGVPAIRLLGRSNDDRRQTEQDRTQRHVGPSLFPARTVLARRSVEHPSLVVLIDDVVTTGASLRSASKVLLDRGSNRIVSTVLAATPLRRQAAGLS